MVLAIFGIEDSRPAKEQLGERALSSMGDYLSSRLAAGGAFQLVPPADLQKALAERKADSYQACYDESCQIEIGKELAAQKSLATKITRLGRKSLITATLYDLTTGTTDASASWKGRCGEDELIDAVDDLATQLRGGRTQGFGKGLGALAVVKSAKLELELGAASFADLDTTYLELVQNAKRAESDKALVASEKAKRWAQVAAFKGPNQLKAEAQDRVAYWNKVDALRVRFEEDHKKLAKLLSFDDDILPKAQKEAAQKEMDEIYAPYRKALALSGSPAYAEIMRREAEAQRKLEEKKALEKKQRCDHLRGEVANAKNSIRTIRAWKMDCKDWDYENCMQFTGGRGGCARNPGMVEQCRKEKRAEQAASIASVEQRISDWREQNPDCNL